MRLSSSIAAVAAAHIVAASTTNVYTYDPHWQPSTHGTLSPVEARLVLAQRAGAEDYHEADSLKEGVLEAMNAYGTRRSLFEEAEKRGKRRAFVFLEGADHVQSQALYRAFEVSPAPSTKSSRDLFIDLATQVHPNQMTHLSDADRLAAVRDCTEDLETISEDARTLFCVASNGKQFEAFTNQLVESNVWAVTALVTLSEGILDSVLGSNHDADFGTYEMPSVQSALRKRAPPQKEAPLELEPEATSSIKQSFSAPIPALEVADTNATVAGILPACFSSLSICQSTTKNCTGHGSCRKLYTDSSADPKSSFKDCYTCQCSATTSTDSEGKVSTTYWGGPACQKKDVSVAFWLFALFAVGMAFLVSFAVGEVWGMGEQELPSVIGAGVSGPVKR